ncbi:MAG: hypothetical protein QOJ53_2042 [Sphingomonadales bacterium]|jgi:hypothetical protein|nr:hypothetical protein [Sphingomonadales bacterium]
MIALAAFLLAAQQPADFLSEAESDLLHFRYGWPAAAEREPALRALLRRRMAASHRRAVAMAIATRRDRRRLRFDYITQEYDQVWEAGGDSPQLLSLVSSIFELGTGPHGFIGEEAILWDRAAHREVEARSLLGSGLAGMRARFCAELDRQRAEKREGDAIADPDDPFNRCPPLGDHVLAPADRDGNGRFDTLRVLIPPEAAGPYVESEYIIDIAFEPRDLAAVPERYRPAFEMPGGRTPRN